MNRDEELRQGKYEWELEYHTNEKPFSKFDIAWKVLFSILSIVSTVAIFSSVNDTSTMNTNIKISVMQSGKILVDGTESTISQVEKRLVRLKSEGGMVWYYREAGQQEHPPEAMQVIKLVAKIKLPITLSSKPDFSDYVGEDGKSHLRKSK